MFEQNRRVPSLASGADVIAFAACQAVIPKKLETQEAHWNRAWDDRTPHRNQFFSCFSSIKEITFRDWVNFTGCCRTIC